MIVLAHPPPDRAEPFLADRSDHDVVITREPPEPPDEVIRPGLLPYL
jgi:hypothetical protein